VHTYNEVRQALDPVVGVPFKELAPQIGVPFPRDPRRRKAAGGEVVEVLLRIARNSIPSPDLEHLGTEVKSLPLNTLSTPREWTKICAFNLRSTQEQPDFLRSGVFGKLRSVLFVPIAKVDNDNPDFWHLRPPFLWMPTVEQLERFERDYTLIHDAAVAEDWTRLTGAPGEHLTLNTSDGTTRGKAEPEKRRAWFLKKATTDEICRQNLWPIDAIRERREMTGLAED
jgi:DNA mismatch repair endonuclease MutH